MSMFEDVKEFHRFFGHSIGKKPQFLDYDRMKNRLKWTDEEREEFIRALAQRDLVEAADAIADVVYFWLGTAVEMGIPFDKVWDAVHKSNMTKAIHFRHDLACPLNSEHETPMKCNCGAVQYKEDGKTAKPEGWEPPTAEIKAAIEA